MDSVSHGVGRNDEVQLNSEFFKLLAFVIPDARSLREPESMSSLLKTCDQMVKPFVCALVIV
jgi:hypothetical protein